MMIAISTASTNEAAFAEAVSQVLQLLEDKCGKGDTVSSRGYF
jgi:hypothetical protein